MLTLVLAVTDFSPAAAAKTQSTKGLEGLTEKQIEKSLKEVEYTFTKIIVSDKKGFVINDEELAVSPYSAEVKDGMVAFAKKMNQEVVTQSNTVTRCIEDAVGITRVRTSAKSNRSVRLVDSVSISRRGWLSN
ncbi:hypothetical protein ACL9ST_10830 [Bacillus australimaris]|uniref:hypothetical protein n=1 Tax=Bacillus australimaris TaxID=1326968 RepID=UPI0039B5870D